MEQPSTSLSSPSLGSSPSQGDFTLAVHPSGGRLLLFSFDLFAKGMEGVNLKVAYAVLPERHVSPIRISDPGICSLRIIPLPWPCGLLAPAETRRLLAPRISRANKLTKSDPHSFQLIDLTYMNSICTICQPMLANRISDEYVNKMCGHRSSKGYGRIEAARETESTSASSGPSDEML